MNPVRRIRRGAPRVGLFGLLGSGNLGNDGSLEAVVSYLREAHPEARLGFFAMGPEQCSTRYDAPATALQWYEPHAGTATGAHAAALKIVGKLLDPFRTLAWVRHYDLVIVPGMGVLEATLPLRPWAFPYSLFWLGVTARLTGTRVALVSVGSSVVRKRTTRWFITQAARLAHYRSFRDTLSREAMRQMGVDVSADPVYPDLAFALPNPSSATSTGAVGVGVMAYYGGNDDRADADDIHRGYLEVMTLLVRKLVDDGRPVRLFGGDQEDEPVVQEILSDLRRHRPGLAHLVSADPIETLPELLEYLAGVDTVIASRFHNVLCALKLAKPTLSISYAAKHDVLMTQMGLGAFCEPARSVDLGRLLEKLAELEHDRNELVAVMTERNTEQVKLLDEQFEALSQALFGTRPAKHSRV
jgi:polysaccharide pyruvyl transferase WcaK-like protein